MAAPHPYDTRRFRRAYYGRRSDLGIPAGRFRHRWAKSVVLSKNKELRESFLAVGFLGRRLGNLDGGVYIPRRASIWGTDRFRWSLHTWGMISFFFWPSSLNSN
jgi:hypothetical protein